MPPLYLVMHIHKTIHSLEQMELEPYLSGAYQKHGYSGHDFFVKKINNEPDSEYFFVIPVTFDRVSLQIHKVQ
jgi:hypothetical protein